MMIFRQKLYLQLVLLLAAFAAGAQESWPSPEVEQMYRNAQQYAARKDYGDAVTTCKQAILLAPNYLLLYKELGCALYNSGRYKEAELSLTGVCTKPAADDTCFEMLAVSKAAQGDNKGALAVLQKGISRFPSSGMLYHEWGDILWKENKKEQALSGWLRGIISEPQFAPNYFNASVTYLNTSQILWGLIYGEIFLCLKRDTTSDDSLKNKLFTGYKKLFDGFASADENTVVSKSAVNFETAVLKIYAQLTPVISDGITTENLTMVRTRFLMDWFATYSAKYPFPLFSYQDTMVKNGRFDIWNQWLFGKAESEAEFNAWNNFHPGDISRFLDWHKLHPFNPSNNKNHKNIYMNSLFDNK